MESSQAVAGSSGHKRTRSKQKSCVMKDCKSHLLEDREVRTFGFPKDPKVCEKWIKFAGIDPSRNLKWTRMCSLHFARSAFKNDWIIDLGYPIGGMSIKKDAVPTIKNPLEEDEEFEGAEKESSEEEEEVILEALEDPEDPLSSIHQPQKTEESQTVSDQLRIECVALESEETECILFRDPEINPYGHIKYSSSSQTNSYEDPELQDVKEELETTLKQLEDVEAKKIQLEEKISRYRSYFNGSQQRMVEESRGFVHWPPRDIAAALSLYKMGPNSYRYLKEQQNYPLPTARTLQMWVKDFKKKQAKQESKSSSKDEGKAGKAEEQTEEQMDIDKDTDTDTEDP